MIKHRIQITDPRAQEAIQMYKDGKGVKPICKELRMDGVTLNRFLNELGIKKTHGEVVRKGKTKAVVNDGALDVLTSEALYWIGFLYADGHIEKDRPRISITVSVIDKNHLYKFATFFGKDLAVRLTETKTLKSNGYTSNEAYRVSFSSQKIYQKLVELGFTNRKTWDISPHNLLKNSRDFWRGVIDGDGSLWHIKYKGVDRYAGISLCGHEDTLKAFMTFIEENGIGTKTKIRKEPKREFLWTVTLHTNIAKNIATVLYKDSTIYLDRKYEKYLSWIK